MSRDYSLDEIGKRLRGEGLTKHERILANDDHCRVGWMIAKVATARVVVDIGASDGWIANELALQGHTVFAIERHLKHQQSLAHHYPPMWLFFGDAEDGLRDLGPLGELSTALLGEVLEHLAPQDGNRILAAIGTETLVVTVPNRRSKSYDNSKRSRWNWPDHKRHFTPSTLRQCLDDAGWNVLGGVEPIVGALEDSIWLGAVCRRA
jgi:2-polyprenyl-3-methyl-5-hydroxy-6-metoxy-1,4-benzoquinol methylase